MPSAARVTVCTRKRACPGAPKCWRMPGSSSMRASRKSPLS
ncbi:Uncharacterised protein [Bordetella pertussis]|nr:Uncharacterised protein [Bordetella pertussis]CFW44841.1 Uncharacterised protein [Bordetella pertussis]